MNVEDIDIYANSLANVECYQPFGPENLVYKTNGKMFLLVALDSNPLSFNVKCNPAKAVELREEFSCVLPGYHMNKKHWNTIVVDGSLPNKTIKEFILHSYELIAIKKK